MSWSRSRAAGRFPETSWTLLVAACGGGEEGVAARAEVVSRYYGPAYAYISAIVRDPSLAEDLTQGFFEAAVLSGRLLARVDRAKGSFRPYFKQAVRNYVIDARRRMGREKSRSSAPELRPDGKIGEWERMVPDNSPGPDAAFHTAWVRALLHEALARVEAMCAARGQAEHFRIFIGRYLNESDQPIRWRALGHEFNLDEKTARGRADTVARHFRLVLRDILVKDIGTEEGVDEELAALLALL